MVHLPDVRVSELLLIPSTTRTRSGPITRLVWKKSLRAQLFAGQAAAERGKRKGRSREGSSQRKGRYSLPSSAPRLDRLARSQAALAGGPQVQGRASLWSSREMTAPVGGLLPKGTEEALNQIQWEKSLPPTRRKERTGRSKSSFPAKGYGGAEEIPPVEGCKQRKLRRYSGYKAKRQYTSES